LEFKARWQARQIVSGKISGGVFSKKMIKRYHGRSFAYQFGFRIELSDGIFAHWQNEARSTMKQPSHQEIIKKPVALLSVTEEKVQ
jgi:hypothetical protein